MTIKARVRPLFDQLVFMPNRSWLALGSFALALSASALSSANSTTTVADTSLSAAFYSDSSCLLTINALALTGKTVINADMDDVGSRMLIHCDTASGRRLTLLARGDSLNVSQRVPLLTPEQVQQGEYGMIAWLTRSGVQYTDDIAPRRYVIAGSVMLRKTPPADSAGAAVHNQPQSFARVSGTLEPIFKTGNQHQAPPAHDADPDPDGDGTTEEGSNKIPSTDSASGMQLNPTVADNEDGESRSQDMQTTPKNQEAVQE